MCSLSQIVGSIVAIMRKDRIATFDKADDKADLGNVGIIRQVI